MVLEGEDRPPVFGRVRSAAGCLKLPDDLPPGEYWIEVRVRIASGKRTAEALSVGEFTISSPATL